MQNFGFYTAVGVVGAAADLLTNGLVQNSSQGMAGGLRQFYATAPAWQTAIYAALTFIVVVFFADVLVSSFK
jgi:hypothetical protein